MYFLDIHTSPKACVYPSIPRKCNYSKALVSGHPWDAKKVSVTGAGRLGNLVIVSGHLKGPSQPPPFSMPSKLLILHGVTKSYCFTVSCVPGSMFDYL